MKAMVLDRPGARLALREIPIPDFRASELLVSVRACAVCRTDLHIADGELSRPKLPLVLGHEVVGIVEAAGADVVGVQAGDRVGVAWLGWTCGSCAPCLAGRENLCQAAEFTGYTRDGGYAEALVVEAPYAFRIPDAYRDEEAAPLLCAGLIGYRAYRFAGLGQRLGLYGFGAAAHLLAQLAVYAGREVYAFTKAGDAAGQEFARSLGVAWAGSSTDLPPRPLDAAILFAPVGALIPAALRAVGPGGTVVCAGIHMSDIPTFPYEILWEERVLRSVANLTREDGEAFLQVAPSVPVQASIEVLPLEQANQALDRLRAGTVEGALVLVP